MVKDVFYSYIHVLSKYDWQVWLYSAIEEKQDFDDQIH